MLSPKFEHVKQRYPGLSALLDRVGEYIQTHIRNGQEYVIPKLAAAALHLNDGEAFVLLDLLAKEGVLRRVYNVYCRKNNVLLATVDNLEALDEVSHCDFCNVDHDPSDLKVEVAFVLASSDLKDLAA
jgi:hypothetical protein